MREPTIHLTDGTEAAMTRSSVVGRLLAYAAMLPIAAGALGAWAARSPALARATISWSGGVLCFLAGVRRDLSFRQRGGPTFSQLGPMLWLFVLGIAALLSPRRMPALVLLLLGYGSDAVIDPRAARRHEAPRYFARLRPTQMMLPIASLLLLLILERSRADQKHLP